MKKFGYLLLILSNVAFSQNNQSNPDYDGLKKYRSLRVSAFKAEKIEYLDLSNRKLDSIPSSISKFKNLKALDLSTNKLSKLPNSLSELKGLELLILSSNQFTEIPKSVCELTSLKILILIGNRSLYRIPEKDSCVPNLERLIILGTEVNETNEIGFQIYHPKCRVFSDRTGIIK